MYVAKEESLFFFLKFAKEESPVDASVRTWCMPRHDAWRLEPPASRGMGHVWMV
jgi:hypothetical protein